MKAIRTKPSPEPLSAGQKILTVSKCSSQRELPEKWSENLRLGWKLKIPQQDFKDSGYYVETCGTRNENSDNIKHKWSFPRGKGCRQTTGGWHPLSWSGCRSTGQCWPEVQLGGRWGLRAWLLDFQKMMLRSHREGKRKEGDAFGIDVKCQG